MPLLDNTSIEIVCSGLGYPEGPVYCSNGDIILVEIRGDARKDIASCGDDENMFEPCISRISPSGERSILAKIPGGPNGAAVGPDGDIYICNDGGFDWIPIPQPPAEPIVWFGGNQPSWYTGGKLQKYSPATGKVTDLYHQCSTRMVRQTDPVKKTDHFVQGPDWNPPFRLCGLDDLVFDKAGGMWISDYGKIRERDQDVTALYYAAPDGSSIRQAIYPMAAPNGVALSPGGDRLYVALTFERRVLYYELSAPGVIKPNPTTIDGSYLLTAAIPKQALLDSMAVDEQGNVYVATMLPDGLNPMSNGGITTISPDGKNVDFIELPPGDGYPAPMPSNICFGGDDMKTAYVTCGASGHLLKLPATIPGLKLDYNL